MCRSNRFQHMFQFPFIAIPPKKKTFKYQHWHLIHSLTSLISFATIAARYSIKKFLFCLPLIFYLIAHKWKSLKNKVAKCTHDNSVCDARHLLSRMVWTFSDVPLYSLTKRAAKCELVPTSIARFSLSRCDKATFIDVFVNRFY